MQQATGGSAGKTLSLTDVGRRVPLPGESAPPSRQRRFERPSERRSGEDRERRHRERAIAAWLRSLER